MWDIQQGLDNMGLVAFIWALLFVSFLIVKFIQLSLRLLIIFISKLSNKYKSVK